MKPPETILPLPLTSCRYDGHRDAILRSGDRHQAGASSMGGPEQAPDDINLYAYFSSTAYSGFGDGLRVSTRGDREGVCSCGWRLSVMCPARGCPWSAGTGLIKGGHNRNG